MLNTLSSLSAQFDDNIAISNSQRFAAKSYQKFPLATTHLQTTNATRKTKSLIRSASTIAPLDTICLRAQSMIQPILVFVIIRRARGPESRVYVKVLMNFLF